MLMLIPSCATIAGVNEEPLQRAVEPGFSYEKYIDGAPGTDMRVEGGFYFWRTGNIWHVRLARKNIRPRSPGLTGPVVTGSLQIRDAVVYEITRHGMGMQDDVRQKMNDIYFAFELREDRPGDVEGFDFRLRPTGLDYCVTLDLMVEGVPRPGIVRLGSYMHIPEALPLNICSHSSGPAFGPASGPGRR